VVEKKVQINKFEFAQKKRKKGFIDSNLM